MIDYRLKQMVPMILASTEQEFETLYANAIIGYMSLNPEIVSNAFNDKYQENAARIDGLKLK